MSRMRTGKVGKRLQKDAEEVEVGKENHSMLQYRNPLLIYLIMTRKIAATAGGKEDFFVEFRNFSKDRVPSRIKM